MALLQLPRIDPARSKILVLLLSVRAIYTLICCLSVILSFFPGAYHLQFVIAVSVIGWSSGLMSILRTETRDRTSCAQL